MSWPLWVTGGPLCGDARHWKRNVLWRGDHVKFEGPDTPQGIVGSGTVVCWSLQRGMAPARAGVMELGGHILEELRLESASGAEKSSSPLPFFCAETESVVGTVLVMSFGAALVSIFISEFRADGAC